MSPRCFFGGPKQIPLTGLQSKHGLQLPPYAGGGTRTRTGIALRCLSRSHVAHVAPSRYMRVQGGSLSFQTPCRSHELPSTSGYMTWNGATWGVSASDVGRMSATEIGARLSTSGARGREAGASPPPVVAQQRGYLRMVIEPPPRARVGKASSEAPGCVS
jgi:hypothetical protein